MSRLDDDRRPILHAATLLSARVYGNQIARYRREREDTEAAGYAEVLGYLAGLRRGGISPKSLHRQLDEL